MSIAMSTSLTHVVSLSSLTPLQDHSSSAVTVTVTVTVTVAGAGASSN